jgi:hypothetical protein
MWKAIFQNKFTKIHQKNYNKSLLCGLISQPSAEKPSKNGGVRKANWLHTFPPYVSKFARKLKCTITTCMFPNYPIIIGNLWTWEHFNFRTNLETYSGNEINCQQNCMGCYNNSRLDDILCYKTVVSSIL